MFDVVSSLGSLFAIAGSIFVTLLLMGANFAPAWAKSHAFLIALGAVVIAGSNALV